MSTISSRPCPHCDKPIAIYRHTMNPTLVKGLLALHRAGGGPMNIKELGMTRNVWDNFQKLRYFGLVDHVGGPKSGKWRISKTGQQWIARTARIYRWVNTSDGEVVQRGGGLVSIEDITGGAAL